MKRAIYLVIIISVLFTSCENFFVGECFSGDAEVVRRSVNIEGDVKRIYIMGEAEVYLLDDSTQFIEYEVPENLEDDLEFRYEDGELIYGNHITCKWRKGGSMPKLYLSLPYIQRYDLLEYAPVKCLDTLKYNHYVKFYSYGPGDVDLLIDMKDINIQSDYVADITVKGKVDKLGMYYKLHGRFFGQELMAKSISITHNGENDVHLYPVETLKATIKNYGNIILHNLPPNMEVTTEGEGNIIVASE